MEGLRPVDILTHPHCGNQHHGLQCEHNRQNGAHVCFEDVRLKMSSLSSPVECFTWKPSAKMPP